MKLLYIIWTLYQGIDQQYKKFIRVLLERCQADIEKKGYKEQYQNGQNQHGYKRSIAADLYATYIKQLIDLSPEGKGISKLDRFRFGKTDLDRFIDG